MAERRRSLRKRKAVSFAEQPDEEENPVSPSPQREQEESDFEAGSAAAEPEAAGDGEDPEPYLTRENARVEKYGSLYAADEEMQRRKELYRGHYDDFLVASEQHKLKSDHLAQRKKMWAEGRDRIRGEIASLEAKIDELRVKGVKIEEAEAELEGRIGEDAEKWEIDKVKLEEWRAFFDLERDEIDG